MTQDAGTAERIIDLVEALIMTRGFNAVSYADIAARIGIRKASIHYHFPTKADLGEAVIRRYADAMGAALIPLQDLKARDYREAFERFLAVFAAVAEDAHRVCLGGVLGAEYETLPEGMRAQVRRFYGDAQTWLTALLDAGRKAGAFRFAAAPDTAARAIFSTMEGALIIRRALGEPQQMTAAFAGARALIGLEED